MEHFDLIVIGSGPLHLKSGRKVKSDLLLWANGHAGNSNDMNLESLGLKSNARCQLTVNGHSQTNLPHIYAVGDLVGPPAMASAAFVQGTRSTTFRITRLLRTA